MRKKIDYHDEISYDSTRENWSGVIGLLMVPLLILTIGVGLFTGIGKSHSINKSSPINYGVGGGPPISISPSIPYNAPDNLQIIQ